MGKRNLALILAAVVLFGVISSGCLGGGNSRTSSHYESSTTPSTSSTVTSGTATQASATWETPWNAYNPVMVDGKAYYVTQIEYTFTIKTGEGERSYKVVKKRGYIKAHVYSEEKGGKKDLGEFNLFAYCGEITPLTGPANSTFEYIVAVKERTNDTDRYFLQPLPNFEALGTGNAVVVEARSGGGYFYWSNPPAIGQYSELPYTEGDANNVLSGLGNYLFQGWVALVSSGAWSGLEGHDLLKKDEYIFSFMGMGYHYKISPDGSVTLGGKSFRVSNAEWSYSLGGVSMQGKATIAPSLPVPIGAEGNFVDLSSGTKIYSKLKIDDIKLEGKIGGLAVSIDKPTSPGEETGTSTGTSTQSERPSSDNWKLAWDASKPMKIGEGTYVLKAITYEITYKLAGQEVHYTMERGYERTDDGYKAYAVVRMEDGSEYRFKVYFSPDELEEYTGWVLWMPSVLQLTESNSPEKVVIEGPSCSYTYDEESGEMNGDMNCGAEIRESPFDQIWDLYNGFAGGIYGDVVEVISLSGKR
ncbi:hypothetical protein [Thermococcus sp.]|uniref:hypothetical protein n=1 Tax=Thermococcus sp. TaxID=35749 RepID=UPI0026018D6D|nr:hypothetical protein [Thermococcus sp.]